MLVQGDIKLALDDPILVRSRFTVSNQIKAGPDGHEEMEALYVTFILRLDIQGLYSGLI